MTRKITDRIGFPENTLSIELENAAQGVVAVYFRMTEKPIAKTVELKIEDVFVDLDEDSNVVGIEMVNPRVLSSLKRITEELKKRFGCDPFATLSGDRVKKLQALLV